MTKKTYFLTPGWDYPSDKVLLGSIIANPTQPELALYTPSSSESTSQIKTTSRPNFTINLLSKQDNNNTTTKPGLFATFLRQYGLGNEESFTYDRTAVGGYSFKGMQTRTVEPELSQVNQIVTGTTGEQHQIASFFRASEYKTPLYMITSLKTIRSAGVSATSSTKGPGWSISLNLEAAAEAPPIVFAFQLTEVTLSPDDGRVSLSSDEFSSSWSGSAEEEDTRQQKTLDQKFGEGLFTSIDGFDEEDGAECQIVAPVLTSFDLLTASSARTDLSVLKASLHRNHR